LSILYYTLRTVSFEVGCVQSQVKTYVVVPLDRAIRSQSVS
jgi:hypothetical protein